MVGNGLLLFEPLTTFPGLLEDMGSLRLMCVCLCMLSALAVYVGRRRVLIGLKVQLVEVYN